jgi:hypothetical protein
VLQDCLGFLPFDALTDKDKAGLQLLQHLLPCWPALLLPCVAA